MTPNEVAKVRVKVHVFKKKLIVVDHQNINVPNLQNLLKSIHSNKNFLFNFRHFVDTDLEKRPVRSRLSFEGQVTTSSCVF